MRPGREREGETKDNAAFRGGNMDGVGGGNKSKLASLEGTKVEKKAGKKTLQLASPFSSKEVMVKEGSGDSNEVEETLQDTARNKKQKPPPRYAPPFYEEEKGEIDMEDQVHPGAYNVPGIDFIGENQPALAYEEHRTNDADKEGYKIESYKVEGNDELGDQFRKVVEEREKLENERKKITIAEVVNNDDNIESQQKGSMLPNLFGIIITLIVVVLTIVTVIPKNVKEIETKIDQIITDEFPDKKHLNVTPVATPQHFAFNWLVNKYKGTNEEINSEKVLLKFTLSTIYYSTYGDEWVNRSNWLTTEEECTWHGIICSEDNVIVALNLSNNNLVGRISREISKFYLKIKK